MANPPDRDLEIAAKLGLVSELAATAPTWTFFRLRLFLQSTKSVQGARLRYRIATPLRSILPRLLHNFCGIPLFAAWIETDEGLLPFGCASPQPCIASRGIEIVSVTDYL